jgi:NDP-sugar pyrophosphorylase family protein
MVEQLRRAGVEVISILRGPFGRAGRGQIDSVAAADSCGVADALCTATELIRSCGERGFDAVLVIRVAAYVDFDLKGALQFHREQGVGLTRAFDKETPLDIWIIDLASVEEGVDILETLESTEASSYVVRGYVNRLEHPRDLRRLAVDGLTSRCGLRPQGSEIRPGVWLEEGAQVHRDARIVAPAFIGRGSRIAEQCLITRCSCVEGNSQVDYGTVVEDSSILPNSYVGIGLDLSHSIVDGSNLLNLERDVILQVSDPRVIRENRVQRNRPTPVLFGMAGPRFASIEDGLR